MDRIQQIYSELPKTFSKEISLRQQHAATGNVAVPANPLHTIVPGNLKRDRSDEPISEVMSSKRRDTGEGKMLPPSLSPSSHSASGMMPPPSSVPQQQQLNPSHGVTLPAATHFSLPMSTSNTNGVSGNMIPPQLQQQHGGGGMGIDPSVGMMNTSDIQRAAARERDRQQQLRLAQQASRQLSPQSSQPQPGSISNVSVNAAAGPSSGGGGGGGGSGDLPQAIAALPQPMQQAYRILNTPNHPYIKYMMQNVPGFHTMPLQLQLHKMVSFQVCLPCSLSNRELKGHCGRRGFNNKESKAIGNRWPVPWQVVVAVVGEEGWFNNSN